MRNSPRYKAMTLIEVMVAVALFAISLIGFLMGLMYIQRQNRTLTQRELASGKLVEILELVKNSNYDDIRYSTTPSPVYLRRNVGGTWDTDWRIPQTGEWITLPVTTVDSDSAADPSNITNKLPDAQWRVVINTVTKGAAPAWTYRSVAVTLRWRYLPSSGDWREMSMTTFLCPNFTHL